MAKILTKNAILSKAIGSFKGYEQTDENAPLSDERLGGALVCFV
jgi:hypothetical protein